LSWGLRLVRILRSPEDSNIVCELSHTTLVACRRKFAAFSYVWDDPNFTQPITINDVSFEVTTNLYTALRRLRSENEPRVLWVDAICIDQSNLEERGVQVFRMWAV
ncbi:heterokaryon incompatibility protein-domain-containing protein, partial [Clohesyomyces aquaticus]